MKLANPELRRHVERVCAIESNMSHEHQFVTALFDAYGFLDSSREKTPNRRRRAFVALRPQSCVQRCAVGI